MADCCGSPWPFGPAVGLGLAGSEQPAVGQGNAWNVRTTLRTWSRALRRCPDNPCDHRRATQHPPRNLRGHRTTPRTLPRALRRCPDDLLRPPAGDPAPTAQPPWSHRNLSGRCADHTDVAGSPIDGRNRFRQPAIDQVATRRPPWESFTVVGSRGRPKYSHRRSSWPDSTVTT